MLEGVDHGWVLSGSRNFAIILTSGGHYIFKVRASNNNAFGMKKVFQFPLHTPRLAVLVVLSIADFGSCYHRVFSLSKSHSQLRKQQAEKLRTEIEAHRT